jgi:transcriptional regulator with XRE-family HTH domain
MARKEPDPVDKIVGRNVRVYRLAKDMSQTDLADQLGLTFQQVQKYEKGTNRIGSGRLLKISKILDVDITAFFEGCRDARQAKTPSVFDQLAKPQSFHLMQAFSEIEDPQIRRSLVSLVEQIAATK